eukprot:8927216-Prorocentrum_lima.AAC.1
MVRHAAQGRLTHFMRSTPPAFMDKCAEDFDEKFVRAYVDVVGLDKPNAEQRAQMGLPTRWGG